MEVVLVLLGLAAQGMLVGAAARLVLPGPDPMTIGQTMAVGLGGSLLAGIVVYALSGGRQLPGFLTALAFSTLIVYAVRRRRSRATASTSRSASDPSL